MTDLEKFKNFFDEMGIKYRYVEYPSANLAAIDIDEKHIYISYCNSITIDFELDSGKFIEFEAWGE